jgi:nucleoside-diphosphate-sugar epimerase
MAAQRPRILITGGGTFLGNNIAAALLANGAEVTLLVQFGSEENLGVLADQTTCWTADFWDSASLRGRARGHRLVIHTIGSLRADPKQGLSYERMNYVSTRNVAAMCVSDGVPEMMLISSSKAPWTSRRYIRSKREAESYLTRVGIHGTIIRAPVCYIPGSPRPMLFHVFSALGQIPPLSWTWLGRIAPLPVDVLARGVAKIALERQRTKEIYYARDLRRYARQPVDQNWRILSQEMDSIDEDTRPHGVGQYQEDGDQTP